MFCHSNSLYLLPRQCLYIVAFLSSFYNLAWVALLNTKHLLLSPYKFSFSDIRSFYMLLFFLCAFSSHQHSITIQTTFHSSSRTSDTQISYFCIPVPSNDFYKLLFLLMTSDLFILNQSILDSQIPRDDHQCHSSVLSLP